ncbi:MAG: GNAT family N-acetyltransferase [Leptolyngbyaceae cyanobacterium]
MSVPLIETERLWLRPFMATDAEALFAYTSAPEFSQYVKYPSPTTLPEVQDFLPHVLMAEEPDCLSWAICQRNPSQLIGSIQMTYEATDCVSVHYDVSHTVYGNGFATEALQGGLRWALANLPEVTQLCGDTQRSVALQIGEPPLSLPSCRRGIHIFLMCSLNLSNWLIPVLRDRAPDAILTTQGSRGAGEPDP